MWPWPDRRSRSRSLTFWISENCTFLRLPRPLFWRGAHNWWVITRHLVFLLVMLNSMGFFCNTFRVHCLTDRQYTATIHFHRRHLGLLLLLSPKADTHVTIPWRVEGWVDLGTAVRVRSPCGRLYMAEAVVILYRSPTKTKLHWLMAGHTYILIYIAPKS